VEAKKIKNSDVPRGSLSNIRGLCSPEEHKIHTN
jgi:hypothetical protein